MMINFAKTLLSTVVLISFLTGCHTTPEEKEEVKITPLPWPTIEEPVFNHRLSYTATYYKKKNGGAAYQKEGYQHSIDANYRTHTKN